MKSLITLLTLTVALVFSNNSFGKTWRVNNTAGVTADYTDIQSAINAASAGDTIHVEPSATNYSGISITKPLVIVGNGVMLTVDTGLQANNKNSTIAGAIYFSSGSAGSCIQGVNIVNYVYVQDQNIIMRRNLVQYPVYVYSSNFTYTNNFMYYYGVSNQATNLTNINISNNIFYYYAGFNFDATCTGSAYNNTGNGSSFACYNFQVNNNILLGGNFTINNNVYFNNIGDGTQFGNANNNQQNVSGSNIFTYTGTYDQDPYWQLKSGSPAIGAGYGGVDCGAYGGPNPYKIACLPAVPTIYKLVVPVVGTSSISVTVSTKSNN